jgi:hypothetical protein
VTVPEPTRKSPTTQNTKCKRKSQKLNYPQFLGMGKGLAWSPLSKIEIDHHSPRMDG